MALVTSKLTNKEDSSFCFSESSAENFAICKSPNKLKLLLSSIKKDTTLHYVSDGDWSLHDLLMELMKEYKPAELYLTTYAIRELAIRQLVMAMDRKELISVNMIADYRTKVRTPEVYQLASMNMNKICLHSIHAKVAVLRSATGCVTVLGSCNLTSNPRIEAGIITLNESVANFHINWINKIIENAEIFE